MGQFLTKLDRPKLWDGYPFLLSALIGDVDDDLVLVVKEYNASGTYITETESTTSIPFQNSIVNWDISQISGTFGESVSYILVYLKTEAGEILTDDLRIDIIQPCSNSVYLMGRNSLGGVINWMFDFNQDESFDFGNTLKNKRLVLFSFGITINEWESLHDLITLGAVYKNNIVEFTSATIKSHTRIGNQVYSIDSNGSKIGVIVIPTKNTTNTKKIGHNFEIEIEFPETFSI